MRTCVIFNPVAKGEKAKRLRRHLDEIGSQCALKLTWAAGTASLLAAEAVRDGFETIVAAGGDGTVNEVLNGLASVPEGLKRARLGVLPLGTVNVYAKEYGIPTDVVKAWAIIQRGHERTIDLPWVEHGPPDKRQRRCFAQLAGAGLDARAIQLVNWQMKKLVGPIAYVVAGFRALSEKPHQIEARNCTNAGTGQLVLLGNGKFYGGKFPVFPDADPADGMIDVSIFPRVDFPMLCRLGSVQLTGQHIQKAGVQCFRTDCLELTAPMETPLELEGDTIGALPARITVQPRALRIVVP
jgi:YegS/Rv2252/BmrU family lipid kinase